MVDIVIHYYDEVRCKLEVERSIAYELKQRFSFYANGYKFSPAFKSHQWDGKISLYNIRDSSFYVGLIPDLIKYAKENGYSIAFSEDSKPHFRPSIRYIDNWLQDNWSRIGKFEPKDYQYKSVEAAIKDNKTLILSPTGSGKSYIIYLVVRYLLENSNGDILINVPSISLVNQLYSDFEDYVADDWKVPEYVGKIHGTAIDKNAFDKRCVISTWQSMKDRVEEYFTRYNHYIIDEAHTAEAKCISGIIDNLSHAKFRMGCTGTLDGSSIHEIEMKARFGRLHRFVTTSELMERGDLAKLNIECLCLKYQLEECKTITKKTTTYQEEIDYIVEHQKRSKFLINLALSQKKNTLMLFNFVERHGKEMLPLLESKADKNLKKIYFIYGKVEGEEREQIRKVLDSHSPTWYDLYVDNSFVRLQSSHRVLLENGDTIPAYELKTFHKVNLEWLQDTFKNDFLYKEVKNPITHNDIKITKREGCSILLASYGTLAVGVNIKNLHSLIFCHPLKKQIRLLQSIGRVIRTAAGKEKVTVYDIVDNFTYKRGKYLQENHTFKHFQQRLQVYESENFEYEIVNVDI